MKKCKKYNYLYVFSKVEVLKQHFYTVFKSISAFIFFLCYLFLLYLHSKETDCESYALTLLQESVSLTPIYIYIKLL